MGRTMGHHLVRPSMQLESGVGSVRRVNSRPSMFKRIKMRHKHNYFAKYGMVQEGGVWNTRELGEPRAGVRSTE